jgi:spermidine synthase
VSRTLTLGIFVLSGAAGLIFEVVWARQLVLVFGNTTQAISAILTGFFGGLAIGSWFGGKIADRASRPLRLYGVLEICLVGVVLLTPVTFGLIHDVYRSAFGWLQTEPRQLALVRFALTMVALAPATVLMGATLPTLTRYLARAADGLSFAFARLYLANTMGAILGAAAAGFALIELFGLHGALLVGATCSGVAGVVALAMDFYIGGKGASPPLPAAPARPDHLPAELRLALLIAFISGLTSLSYQTLWMRLISSGTGNLTYVFTLILTVFLTGLAMGAVEYKRIESQIARPVELLAITQIATSVLVVAGMYVIVSFDSGSDWLVLKTVAAVLPATFVMGLSLPATASLLGGKDSEVGSRSGMLLGTNTVGAIVGTFVVPFVVIPAVGSAAAVGLVAIVNAVTGLVLASHARNSSAVRRRVLVTAGAAAAFCIAIVLASGRLFIDPNIAYLQRRGATLYRSAEDEIASVQSGSIRGTKQLWVAGSSMTILTIDAKLMAVLPLILRPSSRTVLGIAFGMGSSHRASVIAGLRADVVDLVPSVPLMFDTYYPDAHAILADRNSKVIVADGRNYVELTERTYDIIIVDPPPPVESSGASIISSREFYAASKRRLNTGGVMMQFVPLNQTVREFRAHVRTFRDVFPNVIVAAGPANNGFYMLGSELPIEMQTGAIRNILSRPGVLADLSSAADSREHSLDGWAALIPKLVLLSGDQVAAFGRRGPLVTDDHPLPEYFLLRKLFGPPSRPVSAARVRVPAP